MVKDRQGLHHVLHLIAFHPLRDREKRERTDVGRKREEEKGEIKGGRGDERRKEREGRKREEGGGGSKREDVGESERSTDSTTPLHLMECAVWKEEFGSL